MRLIGIDTGGTFTDTVIVDGDGRIGVGKSLTTPGRLPDGVLASIGVAAKSLGMSLDEVLAGADILSHGTTVGLNALLTSERFVMGDRYAGSERFCLRHFHCPGCATQVGVQVALVNEPLWECMDTLMPAA